MGGKKAHDAAIDDPSLNDPTGRSHVQDGTLTWESHPQTVTVRCPYCHREVHLSASGTAGVKCSTCGSFFRVLGKTEEPAAVQPRVLHHFELLEELGRGAFGTVWRARDTQLDRLVAIKIPRASWFDAEDIERVMREARAAAQLQHPNIVAVHAVGRDGDIIYIVSDYIPGVTLAQWLKKNKPSFREAAQLCLKLARALQHAHACGVIHRDLKPSNIMLRAAEPPPEVEPCIMDFGLAKRDVGEVTLTMEGNLLGTPAYMSPEQAQGYGHLADRRSDVYSLGVILFELLTGERPFRGDIHALLDHIVRDDVPSPRSLNGHIPRDLNTICLKSLEREPRRRYSTAGSLAEDLERFLRSEPIIARPMGTLGRMWRWSRRRPALAGLMLALVLGLAGTTSQWLHARAQTAIAQQQTKVASQKATEANIALDAAKRARSEAETQRQRANDELLATRRNLYVANIKEVQHAWEIADVDRAIELLERHVPRDDEEDVRSFAWYYWWRECHREVAAAQVDDYVVSIALLPAADTVAIATHYGETRFWHLASGELQPLENWSGGVGAFSPDGHILAGRGGFNVAIWDLIAGKQREPLQGHHNTVNAVAFSPDGATLASAGDDDVIRLWDVMTGHLKQELKITADPADRVAKPFAVAFAPSGDMLAAAGYDRKIRLWNLPGAAEPTILEGHADAVSGLAFSPNGIWLASSSRDDTARIWRLDTREVSRVLEGHYNDVLDVAFSPDGRLLATAGVDRTIRLWDLTHFNKFTTLKGHASGVSEIRFSSDGRLLVSSGGADHSVKVWHVPQALESERLSARAIGIAASSDGRLLAAGGGQNFEFGEVTVWDTGSRERLYRREDHAARVESLAFSHDDTLLASVSIDGKVNLRRVTDGSLIRSFEDRDQPVECLTFSRDGTSVLLGCRGGSVKFWDTQSGEIARTLDTGRWTVKALAVSPDGSLLVTGAEWSKPVVDVWNMSTRERQRELDGFRLSVSAVTFSLDGQLLATGSSDRSVIVWETGGSWNKVATLRGHNTGVRWLSFSPDAKTLAVAHYDGVTLWDCATYEPISTFDERTSSSVTFLPDGRTLACGTMGHVSLFQAVSEEERARPGLKLRESLLSARSAPPRLPAANGPGGAAGQESSGRQSGPRENETPEEWLEQARRASREGRFPEAVRLFGLVRGSLEQRLAADPHNESARQQLADCLRSLGLVHLDSHNAEDAEQAFRLELPLREQLLAGNEQSVWHGSQLAAVLNNLGFALQHQGLYAEALPLYEQAIVHQRAALDEQPENPTFRMFLRNHYWGQAQALLALEDHARAAQVAGELPQLYATGWNEHVRAAQLLVRCAALAQVDANLSESDRQTAAEIDASRGVQLLQQAVDNGMPNDKNPEQDPAFESLRDRADFRALVEKIRKASP